MCSTTYIYYMKYLFFIELLTYIYYCFRLLFHIHPLIDQLVAMYNYFTIQLTASLKVLGKFSAYLLSVFIDFSKNVSTAHHIYIYIIALNIGETTIQNGSFQLYKIVGHQSYISS